jgi:hypothetical protein
MIEGVEKLRAELEPVALGHPRLFENRKVEIRAMRVRP